MWLYCLCGRVNLGPFRGMASSLLAFHTYFILSFQHDPFATCVLGLQLSALEIYSVVQRCCYFVVSSLVHSLSTHLQKKSAELLIARVDLMNVRAQRQGPPDLSNWVWEDALNTSILGGKYIGDGAADETLSYLKGFLNVGDEKDRQFATVTLKGRPGTLSHIFCHMGLMGMGKTRLHNELCSPDSEVGKSVVKAMEEVGKLVRLIRHTYNVLSSYQGVKGPINADTFWKHLLYFHGLKAEEAAKVNNAGDAVRHIRDKLDMQADATLVVCVDELMQMPYDGDGVPDNAIGRLMGDLLTMQDSSDARLVFLFSAVTDKMLKAAKRESNRATIPAKLPRLSEDQIRELLFEEHPRLKEFKDAPMFVLLLKLCAPTPRYVLEGLPKALSHTARKNTLETISAYDLGDQLQTVLQCSGSQKYYSGDSVLVEGAVRCMLQGKGLEDTQRAELSINGWLWTRNDKELLHPMVLRAWAEEEGRADSTTLLPNVVRTMFRFDLQATNGAELFAEKVFIYFEQARRLSLPDDATTTLRRHYPGGDFHDFPPDQLDLPLTVPKRRIVNVGTFKDMQSCSDTLSNGCILISNTRNEQGVECIFPFHRTEAGTSQSTVWCGGVQVKFTEQEAVPNTVGENIFANSFMEWLDKKKSCKCFGILVSTQQGNAADFDFVCSFNAETLTELMEPCVGPLRFLYEMMPAAHLQKAVAPTKRKHDTESESESEAAPPPKHQRMS